MKIKALALSLALVMVLGMSGCSSSSSSTTTTTTTTESTASEATTEATTEEVDDLSYEKPKFLAMGTAASGGAMYSIGIAMADLISTKLDIQTTAQVTGGTVENCTLVQDGTVEIGLTMNDTCYAAFNGEGVFSETCEDLRGIFNGMSAGVFHVVVLDNSDIETMADLEGKRVVMGPAGGGAITVAEALWPEYGFTIDDVDASYISFTDGIAALKDGTCDAVLVQSAAPASAIQELAASGYGFHFVPIEDDVAESLLEKYPFYSMMTMESSVYGSTGDAQVLYIPTTVVCHADLDDGLVYDITKMFYEEVEAIRASHPCVIMNIEDGPTTSIELHPGAQRYYEEMGLL
ncbi:TAXI family TRAP transporter solute-binding subunit [Bengtsoniella intestinalis]|uniref:TAXI family TRAP transporter solute-binding subunit n=1 Tax=Bengtsoniella intestinalis TaxID=3073143 RepID=UPI00391F4492